MDPGQTSPTDLLLVVFIHGFKGDDPTFLDFPSRLAHDLQQTIQNVTVESLIFPAYETKGELKDAVEHFVEWLQHQVVQREVSQVIALGGERSGATAAKIVLCGHSMGGLVIADALLAMQKTQTDDGPLWPRVIALLAFDTPYLGLHPNIFTHQAEQSIEYPGTVQSIEAQDTSSRSALRKWAAIGTGLLALTPLVIGPLGVVAAAGATSTITTAAVLNASPFNKEKDRRENVADSVTHGWNFILDHFKYLENLWNEPAMKYRMEAVLETCQKHRILFRNFYAYLPEKLNQTRPRTFIALPFQSEPVAAHFIAAHNVTAENEMAAHMGMFDPKINIGYDDLGYKTAHLIKEAIVSALEENEKTAKVNEEEVFDVGSDLTKNRQQVGQDGREAKATVHPTVREKSEVQIESTSTPERISLTSELDHVKDIDEGEVASPPLKLLETIPTTIPAALKLSFIRARRLRKEAGKLPTFTMQSIHLSRALIHRLIVLSQDIDPNIGISKDNLEESLRLRRIINDMEHLFLNARETLSPTIARILQADCEHCFRLLENRDSFTRITEISQSKDNFMNFRKTDWEQPELKKQGVDILI